MKKITKASMATISLAASLTMLLAGCGSGSSGSGNTTQQDNTPVNGGTLVVDQSAKWDNEWVPLMDAGQPMQTAYGFSFDTLLNVNQKLQPYPWLASSWTWSADKRTITVQLNPKANWSDGQPIVSADVLLDIDFLASPAYNNKLNGQYFSQVSTILGANDVMSGKAKSFADTGGFKQINDKEFSITFQAPDPVSLSYVQGITPLPSHILGNIPFAQWQNMPYDRQPTVVSGPYVPTQVNGTDSIVYTANKNYWRGTPHISKVIMKYVSPDLEGSLVAAGKVELPLEGVKGSDFLKLKNTQGLIASVQPSMEFSYLGMMDNQPLFSDVRVRQAMEYAINRPAICKGIDKGFATPINSPVPSISWAAAPASAGLNPYNYNPSTAKQLLDAAGYKVGSDGWRIDPHTGKKAVMTLTYMSGSNNTQLEAQEIQQNLQAVGLDVTLNPPLDFTTFYNKLQTGGAGMELYLGAWGLGTDPDPRGLWGSHDSGNYEHYVNPEIDTLIKNTWALPSDFTTAGRAQNFIPFEKFVNQQLPLVFMDQGDTEYLYSDKLHIPASDWVPGFGPQNYSDWWVTN